MKKNSLIVAAIALTMAMNLMAVAPTVTTVWEFKGATRPAYVGGSINCRGMAYGIVGANPYLAVVSREDNKVHILNPATGAETSTLDMASATGGSITINDANLTPDEKLIVSNMADGNGLHFKVYQWDNLTTTPIMSTIIDHNITNGDRFGDQITVTGSISDGTAKIYSGSKSNRIYIWSMTGSTGNYSWNNTPTIYNTDIPGTDFYANIYPVPNGMILYQKKNNPMRELNPTTFNKVVPDNVCTNNAAISPAGNGTQFIKFVGNDTYITYFKSATGAVTVDRGQAAIVKFSSGSLSSAVELAVTPSLGGTNNGNGAGRVRVDVAGSGTGDDIYVYVLAASNGIGKYKITFPDFTNSVEKTNTENINITAIQGKVSVSGIQPSSIEIYNTLGQKLKSIANSTEVATDNLQGIYIVQVKVEGKVVKNIKIAIR